MAYTVSQLITDIKNQYPDCTTAQALNLANKALAHLVQDAPAFRQTEDINLTAGTRFYTLTNEYGKVNAATYSYSATASKSLIETSLDEQDEMYRGYMGTEPASGVPTHYALTTASTTAYTHPIKQKIYLYPTPATTSDGQGYPTLRVTGSIYVAMTTATDLPNYVLDPTWLEEEACWRLAMKAGKFDEANLRRAIARELREKQARSLVSMQARTPISLGLRYGGDRTF